MMTATSCLLANIDTIYRYHHQQQQVCVSDQKSCRYSLRNYSIHRQLAKASAAAVAVQEMRQKHYFVCKNKELMIQAYNTGALHLCNSECCTHSVYKCVCTLYVCMYIMYVFISGIKPIEQHTQTH